MRRIESPPVLRLLLALVLAGLPAACTTGGPVTSPRETPETKLAVEFAQALGSGNYPHAHDLLATSLRSTLSAAQLKADFTNMTGDGTGAPTTIATAVTMESWPDKKADDLQWVYVAIANDTYSEAVTVVVAREAGKLVIRSVEWGRP
jgi:FlaG/FlaF family flagellin (archaellin)